ncbi:diguanylate cyclase [Rhizobiaceae bacterium BDR2-2]|uniref:Diguanylate cyclase n=1 Tax=Ectorhizobium quercum TaxID=2965071 RepID=A0AAE3N4T6_9HYPH|nr:diguanylate cyclase [Ectorhizobium quercum]MCX8998537.1 diguanylate cyclase [Ectorhizobium quercum]
MDDFKKQAGELSHTGGPVPEADAVAVRLRAILEGACRPDFRPGSPVLAFIDQIPFAFFVKDRFGRILLANRKTLDMVGVADRSDLDGKTTEAFFSGENLRKINALEETILEGRAPVVEAEVEKPETGNSPGWMMVAYSPLLDENGAIAGVICFGRDITTHKRAEFMRKGHAVLLEQIARGYPLGGILDGLVHLVEAQLTDIQASILFYEEETGQLLHGAAPTLPREYSALIDGVTIGENVGSCGTAAWRRAPVMVSDTLTDRRWTDFAAIARRFNLRSCWSTPIIDASGTLYGTFALYSPTVREPSGLEMEITAMATDLAAIAINRARAEERIWRLANHDALTGLPNRRHFLERFAAVIEETQRSGHHLVIAYFDLDNFKQINDTMGHGVGDDVLREVADRLRQRVRETDLSVRLGGDEFAVVMVCEPGEGDYLTARLEELRRALSEPMRIGGRTIACSGSMGVAVFPRDGDTPDALLARADTGMYAAKKRVRSEVPADPRRM